ncbi:single-stranded DNA-binding protein [candidate division GN15 bacterium]|nr:single-stranded DNA-binding protein [candidate division GN15 bacterium]
MSVNKAILIGRLGKDPEIRYTQSGKAVANFTIATNERWTGQDGQPQESTTWHNIVVWGRQAEVIKEYMSKGRQIYLEGRISNRSYEDKEGNKRYVSEVVVQNFQFLGDRSDRQGAPAGRESGSQSSPPDVNGGGGDDDDLPF